MTTKMTLSCIEASVGASNEDATREDFPDGFDVAIRCLLEGAGMVDAIGGAAFGGRIVMHGCIGVRTSQSTFRERIANIWIVSPPGRNATSTCGDSSRVRMVRDGLVNTSEIVTHTIPLSRHGRSAVAARRYSSHRDPRSGGSRA